MRSAVQPRSRRGLPRKDLDFPLTLMLFVDIAATAFAGLDVMENGFAIGAILLANLLQLVIVPVVIWCAVIITGARTDVEVVLAAYTPTILFAPLSQTLAVGAFIGQYHVAQTLIANSADPRRAFE